MDCVVCKTELVEDFKRIDPKENIRVNELTYHRAIPDGYHCPKCKIRYIGEDNE